MKTVGIIAEYNPFHNGHAYHIEKAKEVTGADCAVVIMSGNFVQRGTPSILDKYIRTKMALLGGADLVLEIPTLYATSSAELFALGSVLTLEKLHHIDFLCFGSEEGKIEPFLTASSFLLNESSSFQTNLSQFLKQGDSFPKARAKALDLELKTFSSEGMALNSEGKGLRLEEKRLNLEEKRSDLEQSKTFVCQNNNNWNDFLSLPNNILGIEYVKILKKYHSAITPITVKRKNVHYHDKNLYHFFSSASAIREAMEQNQIEAALSSIPKRSHELILKEYEKSFPICLDDFSSHFFFLLQRENFMEQGKREPNLASFLDIKEELANRILKLKNPTLSITEFVSLLKNKAFTYTGIQRGILHYLLNIKKDLLNEAKADEMIYYARVLGMNRAGGMFLREAKKTSEIPFIQQPAKAYKMLSGVGKEMFWADLRAYELYQLIQYEKFRVQTKSEYEKGIVLDEGLH